VRKLSETILSDRLTVGLTFATILVVAVLGGSCRVGSVWLVGTATDRGVRALPCRGQ
jgi:hypothetical protein